MDIKDIRDLAAIMSEMGLTALKYQSGGDIIELKRFAGVQAMAETNTHFATYEALNDEPVSPGIFTIKSPMVGVFYCAPSPDQEPFVAVGDSVHAGDVLCIIETMKIMNEITAERDGTISEICVDNRDVVEFGQPLFRIATST